MAKTIGYVIEMYQSSAGAVASLLTVVLRVGPNRVISWSKTGVTSTAPANPDALAGELVAYLNTQGIMATVSSSSNNANGRLILILAPADDIFDPSLGGSVVTTAATPWAWVYRPMFLTSADTADNITLVSGSQDSMADKLLPAIVGAGLGFLLSRGSKD